MKSLLFIRHAKPHSLFNGPDRSRPLSSEGEATQRQLAERLNAQQLVPTKIYCSPLLRAVQSAKILANHWQLPIVEERALGSDFEAETILNIAQQAPDEAVLFFVGHEPTLAELAEQLVGEAILPAGLPKSGAILLRFSSTVEPGAADDWKLFTPEN